MPLPPPQIPAPRRMPWPTVMVLMLGAFTALLILGRLAWALTEPIPIVAAETSPPTSAGVSSGPAFDPTLSAALIEAANAQATFMAPTPTPVPPTPTYTMLPTPRPLICGPWVKDGEVCTMPKAPRPTPTPLPPCPVKESQDCIWHSRPRLATGRE